MADIPSKLTVLLQDKTTAEIYETLRREKCLSPSGLENRAQVVAVAAEAEAGHRRSSEQGAIGGTREFCIVLALSGGGYLNERAMKLFDTTAYKPQSKPWWRFFGR
jgi:hypothetical protein